MLEKVKILGLYKPSETIISSFASTVKAGFPSPANDYLEERIKLDDLIVKHPDSTFFIDCEGDSMVNAFIPHRSKLVIDRSVPVKSGDIVLAFICGEWTVKYLIKKGLKCWLSPANPKYKDIEITEEMQMQVFGKVIHILIDPEQCSH